MARLFVQYLTIYYKENLPNIVKMAKYQMNPKKNNQRLSKFGQSGEISINLVTLLVKCYFKIILSMKMYHNVDFKPPSAQVSS